MDNNDNHIKQILDYLAKAATVAADGVSEVVQRAGNAVGGKYDNFKLGLELNRLHNEQAKMFEDLGRTLFMVKTGAFEAQQTEDGEEPIDGQETVDKLLQLAEEKQAQIDEVAQKLKEASGERACPVCGKVAEHDHIFCPACGTKLPEEEPSHAGEEAEAPEADENADDAETNAGADDDKTEGKGGKKK